LMNDVVLEVKGLNVEYPTDSGIVHAVRNLSLSVGRGEILGLVGESGCGKSATLLSIMGLLPHPGRITSGSITLDKKDLLSLKPKEMRDICGLKVAMIFQDPMSTLNPAHKIGDQLRETLVVHDLWKKPPYNFDEEYLVQLLTEVGIPSPREVLKRYPHQLSGGMQQRVMIAIALSCRPEVILADEPTTALDVTIQAQILELLKTINRENGTAIVLVTHDLAVASQFCERIMVMYAGEVVEVGPAGDVLSAPIHPYTQGLLRCIPKFEKGVPLVPIPGTVPDLTEDKIGCSFYPRCSSRIPSCRRKRTLELEWVDHHRAVRCDGLRTLGYLNVEPEIDTGWVVDENRDFVF
jgi:oligopeptide/dipeptide ABC transporter ATP-binding protein